MFKWKSRVALVALMAGVAIGTSASALPANWTVQTYFSGPDKTEAVGEYMQTCSGHRYNSGVVTPYYTITTGECARSSPSCDVPWILDPFLDCES